MRSTVDETSPLPPHQWPTGDEDAGGPESTGSTSCPRRRAHVKKKAKPSDGSRWTLRAADGRPSSSAGARSRPRGQRRPESQPPESIPLRAWSARDLGGRFGAEAGDQVPDRPQPRGPMDGIRSAIRPALSLWRWLAWPGPGGKGRNNQGKQNPAWPSRRVLLQPVQCRRRTTAGGCWRSATDGKFWEPQASGPGPYILVLLSLS